MRLTVSKFFERDLRRRNLAADAFFDDAYQFHHAQRIDQAPENSRCRRRMIPEC